MGPDGGVGVEGVETDAWESRDRFLRLFCQEIRVVEEIQLGHAFEQREFCRERFN